ncbi:helix-turn-helix transcriptional regulator [Gordonia sp. NPDC127522]|uniref:helix-turn-helix transcriptional regulator n=1 Tax=Gordonia sp. NPDC127522 TaxID=3345390 RepID=UPI003636504D
MIADEGGWGMRPEDEQDTDDLPSTSWAVLGILTYGFELTGNDVKRWADYALAFFYWSPSVSQVYSELKKLEKLGLVSSRVIREPGERAKRVYVITDQGAAAVQSWAHSVDMDPPVLKHGLILRLWMGNMSDPARLKSLVETHIANTESQLLRARSDEAEAGDEPAWAYVRLTLRWSVRRLESELAIARDLLADIDTAAEELSHATVVNRHGVPVPPHFRARL